jgi:rRNA pseudouridine-1189 N-methylase Emg1 (Nep1/Mra1 family)
VGKDDALQKLMEDKLKAVIQTYNGRLIDNNMIVRKPE